MTSAPDQYDDDNEERDVPRTEVPIAASMSDLFEAAYAHPDGEHIDDEIVDYDSDIASILIDARNSNESIRDFCNREFYRPSGEAIHIMPDELQEFLPVHIIDDQKKASAE